MLSDRRHNLISAHVFCTKTKKRTWISMSVSSIISLRGTNGNANYFTFKVVAYSYRRGLLLEDDYTFILSSTVKPSKETKLERRMRYSLLMKENGWTRAELSRQLGVSRAWVTMTLGIE